MDYLVNLNLNKNELQNAVIQPLAAAPSSPVLGQIYYNSTDHLMYQYNGTAWVAAGGVIDLVGDNAQSFVNNQIAYIPVQVGSITSTGEGSDGSLITFKYITGLNTAYNTFSVYDNNRIDELISGAQAVTVTNVSYNSSTKKIQQTINGTTSDVVTLAAVATSGSYDDLTNKPTIDNTTYSLSGALSSHTFTTTLTPSSGSATTSAITFAAGTGISLTDSGTTITIANTVTNTDTKVNVTARGTTKAYLLGTTTSPTSSAQAVESVAETGVYFDTTAATLVATTFKGALTGTASGNLTSSSTLNAANLSGAIPSAVTATTQTTGDDSTKIATTAFVNASIASAQVGAAMFQGDAPTTFAPTNYKKGYYWIVKTAGTYVGQTCEVGDMIFAIADYNSAYSASDFTVVQYNITDGSTSKKGIVQLYDGIDSTSTSLAATANAVKTAYDLANSYKGTVTSVGISNSGLITISGSPITSSGSITIGHGTPSGATEISSTGFYKIKTDTYGHVNGTTAVVKSDITGLVGNATQSADGLMSATDKATLDSLSAASTGAITHTSLTIAQGQTSVSASGVASKLITYQAYQGGEAVIVDYDGTNFSVASAAASAITIKCVITVSSS